MKYIFLSLLLSFNAFAYGVGTYINFKITYPEENETFIVETKVIEHTALGNIVVEVLHKSDFSEGRELKIYAPNELLTKEELIRQYGEKGRKDNFMGTFTALRTQAGKIDVCKMGTASDETTSFGAVPFKVVDFKSSYERWKILDYK